jgi:hypothetical protein
MHGSMAGHFREPAAPRRAEPLSHLRRNARRFAATGGLSAGATRIGRPEDPPPVGAQRAVRPICPTTQSSPEKTLNPKSPSHMVHPDG